tara:strand:+ start:3446 stop:3667 length:222 start_codon:yes stop_codon:yes gene_type:complete
MKFLKMLNSKRFVITIFMMVAWLVFGYLGIKEGTNMSEFAAYFAALSPFVIGYIYGETKRSSCNKNEDECCKK